MKNKILLTAFIAIAIAIAGCSKKKFKIPATDVPKSVVTTFQQKYPSATVVEWEAEKETGNLVYEVGFSFNDKKMEAAFQSDGTFIKEE